MASKRQRGQHWEFVVKRASVLEKPLYFTFESEAEGDAYVARLEKLLDQGIVPTEFLVNPEIDNIEKLVRGYVVNAHPSPKDVAALGTITKDRGKTALVEINSAWVDDWISEMKRVDKIAPATIRAKVGALARCTDWGMRKKYLTMPDHPLRTLPDGYSQYTKLDAEMAGVERVDVERDRRLEEGEHERIMRVIDDGVLTRKQRPYSLEHVDAIRLLYFLALESAMRLREMFTLTIDQVSITKRTVFLDKTKNGSKRQVPLTSIAVKEIEQYMKVRALPKGVPENQLFPWWNGDTSAKALDSTSDFLSGLFHDNRNPGIFDVAGCDGLKFHDLRHEATSRLFERTQLSEAQIMKITGHKSHKMMMRYANLRGSDLAARLW